MYRGMHRIFHGTVQFSIAHVRPKSSFIVIQRQFSERHFHHSVATQGKKFQDRFDLNTIDYFANMNRKRQEIGPAADAAVRVIGTGYGKSPKALILQTTHTSYIFNCGESCQRLASDHHMKINKAGNIFITKNDWNHVGGLLGMALTLQKLQQYQLKIHGPGNCHSVATLGRRFGNMHKLFMEHDNTEEGAIMFEDKVCSVTGIPLLPTDHTSDDEDVQLPEKVFAYYCKLKPRPRRVRYSNCTELGVKGRDIGKLQREIPVVLPDGRTVTPDEVLGPATPEHSFIVLDVPDTSYLQALETSDIFHAIAERHRSSEDRECLLAIFHMSPNDVLKQKRYNTFLKRFGDEVDHLIVNEDSPGYQCSQMHHQQIVLNTLNTDIFPKLSPIEHCEESERLPGFIYTASGTAYDIIPLNRVNRRHEVKLNVEEAKESISQEALDKIEVLRCLKDIQRQAIGAQDYEHGHRYPEILFLGTGSSIPTPRRNVTGILVTISEDTKMLLDCGEGTLLQLATHYGHRLNEVLRKVKAVYVSHMHADHHMGVFAVLFARQQAFRELGLAAPVLPVLAPHVLMDWYTRMHNGGLNIFPHVLVCGLRNLFHDSKAAFKPDILKTLELENIETTYARHDQFPFCLSMVLKTGFKLAYSGDTMPSDSFIRLGKDCDLLIHEATFDDSLADDALMKKHSTFSQAVEVGRAMRAKFILLTHFSQRYSRLPLVGKEIQPNVGIAFDHMKVNPQLFHLLPYFTDALNEVFIDDYDRMALKHMQRIISTREPEAAAN